MMIEVPKIKTTTPIKRKSIIHKYPSHHNHRHLVFTPNKRSTDHDEITADTNTTTVASEAGLFLKALPCLPNLDDDFDDEGKETIIHRLPIFLPPRRRPLPPPSSLNAFTTNTATHELFFCGSDDVSHSDTTSKDRCSSVILPIVDYAIETLTQQNLGLMTPKASTSTKYNDSKPPQHPSNSSSTMKSYELCDDLLLLRKVTATNDSIFLPVL